MNVIFVCLVQIKIVPSIYNSFYALNPFNIIIQKNACMYLGKFILNKVILAKIRCMYFLNQF